MPDSINQEKGNTRYEILLYKFTKYCSKLNIQNWL